MKRENLIRNLLTAAFAVGLVCQQIIVVQASPGSYDLTFGFSGTAVDDTGSLTRAYKALVRSDGKIVVVGTKKIQLQYQGPWLDGLFVKRYTSTGVLDLTYSYGMQGIGLDAELQSDGKLVVFGRAPHSFDGPSGTIDTVSPVVWRFTTDGALDASFGTNGSKFIDTIDSNYAGYATDYHLEIYGGRIYTAYASRTPGQRPTTYKVTKLSSSGSIYFTLTPPVKFISGEKTFSMKVDGTNGDIIVAGAKSVSGDGILRRYDLSGSVVAGFGNNGESSIHDCQSVELYPKDLVIQPDGKILVHRVNGEVGPGCTSRSMPNGSPDPSFVGIAVDDSTVGPNLALQPDGKMFFYVDAGTRRFNANGTYDLFLYFGCPVLVVQNDQKVVTIWSNTNKITLKRYLLD